MNIHLCKLPTTALLSVPLLLLFGLGPIATTGHGQTKTTGGSGAVTADQQQQLSRLQQLSEQLQKDRDVVRTAVAQHGWDSDEADSAQQHLFQDRQEYRNLRRSLRQAGVSVPSDATSSDRGIQSYRGRHCGHHGEHGCCGGSGGCQDHDGDCCCCGHHGS